jgi:HK97 family phage major capsid protein
MLAAHTVTAYCWTHGDTDVANTLDADDIFQHEALVPIRHRVNAAWFMGRATIRAIQALETANGQLFGQFYGNIGGGPVPGVPSGNTGLRLLGYPIYEVPSAVTGTAGDAVVAGFGDPKGFYIIDRVGMSLEVIPHLWAAAMLPTGTRGIYAWWRNTSLTPNVDSGRRLSIKA